MFRIYSYGYTSSDKYKVHGNRHPEHKGGKDAPQHILDFRTKERFL